VKRTELLKRLRETAQANGLELIHVREGRNHTVYRIGTYQFPVARHREINELTAQGTLKRASEES